MVAENLTSEAHHKQADPKTGKPFSSCRPRPIGPSWCGNNHVAALLRQARREAVNVDQERPSNVEGQADIREREVHDRTLPEQVKLTKHKRGIEQMNLRERVANVIGEERRKSGNFFTLDSVTADAALNETILALYEAGQDAAADALRDLAISK